MQKQNKVDVVVRSFFGGAGLPDKNGVIQSLDHEKWEKHKNWIAEMLASPNVGRVVIVGNGDPASGPKDKTIHEAVGPDGLTISGAAYAEAFADDDRVTCITLTKGWGKNLGSGAAVQLGVKYMLEHGDADRIMVWSPELRISHERLAQALLMMAHYGWHVVGFLRRRYWERFQWALPQHTGFIAERWYWEVVMIPGYVDGEGDHTVTLDDGSTTAALGMDDIAKYLRVLKEHPHLRAGMVGKAEPVAWNIPGDDPQQILKISRQAAVTYKWAELEFPLDDPKDTIERAFNTMMYI